LNQIVKLSDAWTPASFLSRYSRYDWIDAGATKHRRHWYVPGSLTAPPGFKYELKEGMGFVRLMLKADNLPSVQTAIYSNCDKAYLAVLVSQDSDSVDREHIRFATDIYPIVVDNYSNVVGLIEAPLPSERGYAAAERTIVECLLKFASLGFYPFSDLNLSGSTIAPSLELSFPNLAIPVPVVTPMDEPAIRASSRRSGGDGLMALDFSHETAVQRSPPFPKAFSSLDTCSRSIKIAQHFDVARPGKCSRSIMFSTCKVNRE
jgi:hypothetical protein